MPLIHDLARLPFRVLICLAVSLILSACANSPRAPSELADGASFDVAIDHAADDLLVQLQRLPEFQAVLQRALMKVAPIKIMVDNTVDTSGQETAATRLLDSRLLSRAAAKFPQFDVQAESPEALVSARFILASSLTTLRSNDPKRLRYQVNLSLADQRSHLVVAQAAALSSAVGVDSTPTAFFRDSPALTRDRAMEGQIRTAQAQVGSEADGVYLANLSVAALITEALRLYEAESYAEALRVYEIAAARPDGNQSQVLNGLYLSNRQLGRTEAAEQAFGRIISLGLSSNNLSVRFLFRPNSTEFLNDPKISEPYPMWLRVLAGGIRSSQHCLAIVGHSSRTGSESLNDRLSLSRASAIQQRLAALSPVVGTRLQSLGRGFRENLIGIGTDDVRDALDRRVEFKVRSCN